MTEKQLRDLAVSTISGWVGLNENDGAFKQIIDLYNTLKPLPRGYKVVHGRVVCGHG
jgi:hypothetical protein